MIDSDLHALSICYTVLYFNSNGISAFYTVQYCTVTLFVHCFRMLLTVNTVCLNETITLILYLGYAQGFDFKV